MADSTSLCLPNYLVIGAPKAGTTSIHRNLRAHPEVFVPLGRKEIKFFSTGVNFKLGLDFYAKYFAEAGEEIAIGEVTPEYLYSKDSPKRIYESLPDVRLVVSLRNPADRAYSEYKMEVRRGIEHRAFHQAIQADSRYIEKGKYTIQLKRYFQHFGPEQLLILLFDDLITQPQAFYQSIFRFLGVDPDIQLPTFDMRANFSGRPRFGGITAGLNLIYRLRRGLDDTPFRSVLEHRMIRETQRNIHHRAEQRSVQSGFIVLLLEISLDIP